MKPKYLVGNSRGIIWDDGCLNDPTYVKPFSSKKEIKKLHKGYEDLIIYKLVPVEEKKVKEYR